MKTSAFLVVCGLMALTHMVTASTALAAEKVVISVNDSYTFFALPFSLSHSKSNLIVPKLARRDIATSSSVGFTLKTPEGLRQDAGQAVGMVVTDEKTGEHVLYVLYKDTTPTSRVNTLAITHLPFLLVNEKTGTTSQALNRSELRTFVVENKDILPLRDTK